ncbi:MAG: serine/threonine protein kinase, partial [Myxococcales bacterium]|nr:serine/threonine protein kinase [Myxococcales bacterium]
MNAGDQEHEALGVAPTLQHAGPAGSLDEFLDTRGPAADTVPGGIDPEAVEFDVVRDAVRARLFPSLKQRRCIGRYELLRPLGSGGMGMVLAARDPELERDVAVKVLHRAHAEDETRASRLLREARAIARVAHPNVVAVHDAGVHDGQVFLVMELVEGATLRGWLERPRSWLEIVDKLLAAGRGLAAAHAAGVVHRDFKPANVLVGRNGRPRVVDFGLARPTSDEPRRDAPAGEGAASEALVGSLTVTGAVMGTPAY